MNKKVKEIAMSGLIAASITGSLFCAGQLASTAEAHASPMNCTPEMPYPPYNGVCTGGYGNYCFLGLSCSPVPNTPGTWNPGGYTPPNWQQGRY